MSDQRPLFLIEQSPSESQQPQVSSARRWPMFLVSTLALAALALAGWNYHWGSQWRDHSATLASSLAAETTRADDLAEELDDTADQLVDTEANLETVRAELDASRSHVEALEGKVRTLGNQKAQIEDERELAEASADYYLDAAAELAVIGEEFDICVQGLFNWFGALPSFYSSQFTWDRWGADGDAVGDQCGYARGSFWSTYNSYFSDY